jgi:hypothetical protein
VVTPEGQLFGQPWNWWALSLPVSNIDERRALGVRLDGGKSVLMRARRGLMAPANVCTPRAADDGK